MVEAGGIGEGGGRGNSCGGAAEVVMDGSSTLWSRHPRWSCDRGKYSGVGRSRAAPLIDVDTWLRGWRDWFDTGRHNKKGGRLGFGSKILVVGEFCSRKLSDIFFYRPDIPRSTLTISEHNYIKWCHWVHRLDLIPKGLWVRGAGLKLFIVSMNNLLTCLCTGYYVWLNNDGAKLGMLSDIIVLTYSFRLVPVTRDHPLFRIGSQVGCVASSWKEVY